MLSVKNEEELLKAYDRLQYYGIQVAIFEEPDKNNEKTALASEPLLANSKLRRKFSCYKLYNSNFVERHQTADIAQPENGVSSE